MVCKHRRWCVEAVGVVWKSWVVCARIVPCRFYNGLMSPVGFKKSPQALYLRSVLACNNYDNNSNNNYNRYNYYGV